MHDINYDKVIVIGNPPYQEMDEGFGASAKPIYNIFVDNAKQLKPLYLMMIIPARWIAGGKGLGTFRFSMLHDIHIQKLIDYPIATECFPTINLPGGICYFLWERDSYNNTKCEHILKHKDSQIINTRMLNEFPTFIRDHKAISIIKKVCGDPQQIMLKKKCLSIAPFGLSTKVRPDSEKGNLTLYYTQQKTGHFNSKNVNKNKDIIDKWKTIISAANGNATMIDKNGQRGILFIIDILPPKTICTGTYIIVDHYDTEEHAKNMKSFLRTVFVRFLMSHLLISQHYHKSIFEYVPYLDMNEIWTDVDLNKKYKLSKDEIEHMHSQITPVKEDHNG